MKRILVIGSCGAGKSAFSRKLHAISGLPLIHLDRQYWQPGWIEPTKEEWLEQLDELISRDEWIIDGNYGGSMSMRLQRADTVIWLDLPRTVCLYRVLKRVVLQRRNGRPDMAEGCKERFDWDFIKYVWNFPKDKNPLIKKRLSAADPNIRIHKLYSQHAINAYLRAFS